MPITGRLRSAGNPNSASSAFLHSRFPVKIVHRIFAGDVMIVLGTPFFIVHAVHNAVDRRVPAQKSVQSEAVFRRLDLARVALAHRADRIAEGDTSFQKVELAEKLQLVRG